MAPIISRFIPLFGAAFVLAAVQTADAADGGFFSGASKTQPAAAPTAAAPSPTLADLEASEAALADLWVHLPYTARHVMFVSRNANVYGDYEQRPPVFTPGEKLVTYLEPVGYGWKPVGDGVFGFGVTTDFEILRPDGKILAGQRAFQKADLKSHYQNREFFVSLTLTIDGITPGDYIVAYTLHDHVSGRTARIEQPFTVKAAS